MNIYARFINISLRVATLVSRFMFVFFLARYLEPSALGVYGLFTATVGYALYFVGLDFYTYTTRELLKTPKSSWGGFLKDQALLSSVLYLVLILSLLICSSLKVITVEQSVWFFVILSMEHVNQEISRLLITINKQTFASLLLFVRQGLWAIIVVTVMIIFPSSRDINSIYICWALSGILTFICGFIKLKDIEMGGWTNKFDTKWVKAGIKTSGVFLIATLSLRGMQTADRYWIQSMNGLDVVGAYVLFIGMTSALMAFLDAGVFSYSYPTLIKLHNEGDEKNFTRHLVKMTIITFIFIALFIVVSAVAMPWLLSWTGKTLFFNYIIIYKWLMVATVLNALGMIPHYALYAKNKDKPIIYSHVMCIFVFVASTAIISKWNSVTAVPIGLTIAFFFVFIWKAFACYNLRRHENFPQY